MVLVTNYSAEVVVYTLQIEYCAFSRRSFLMWRYWFYQVIVGIVFSENVVFEQGTIPANGQDGGDTLVKVEKVGA